MGPENREVKACRWDPESAPGKVGSTQVKRRISFGMCVPQRGAWFG